MHDQRQRQLAILRLTGLFDRPITSDCLAALRADPPIPGLTDAITPLTDAQWNTALNRLASIDLISLTTDGRLGPNEVSPQSEHAGRSLSLDPSHPPLTTDSSVPCSPFPAPSQLDAHPLIREYFAVQLRTQHAEAFRAAHGRLFDHLCESTPHRPDGLDGLQPLYQAVVHGCLAGRQQDALHKVYDDRILRGTGNDGFYSSKKLGAIGSDLSAVAAFFDQPWSRLSPNLSEADQAWLLNYAGFSLRALGRLTEALEPMRVGLEKRIEQEVWKSAAIISSNLSELEVTLGRLESAVADARRGIDFADRSGDAFEQMSERTTAADALHQSGAADEARGLFADAERMQQARQPQFDLLYSLGGFQYCDLLLAPAERAAWRAFLHHRDAITISPHRPRVGGSMTGSYPAHNSSTQSAATGVSRPSDPAMGNGAETSRQVAADHGYTDAGSAGGDSDAALQACTEVERRATTVKQRRTGLPTYVLLDIALDNLTLSRATLYAWLLRADSSSLVDPSAFSLPPSLSDAVNGLREAGQFDETPKGLLTSSVCHVLAGELELAVDELNEALQIARRGPMPLFHADILLTRARLFAVGPVPTGRVGEGNAAGGNRPYPWDTTPQADLAEARRLIEHHGYLRRMPELEDAEAAFARLSVGTAVPTTRSESEPLPDCSTSASVMVETQQEPDMAFDVFLSHNSQDKPAVRDLKQRLEATGLSVWFDEDQLRPGIPWQQLLEDGIRQSGSIAVLIGKDGLGPWEDEEMQAALRLAVSDKRPVIPVLLPDAAEAPELPMFLGNRTWVDLRSGLTQDALDRLTWGITGRKPDRGVPTNPAPLPVVLAPQSNPPAPVPASGDAIDEDAFLADLTNLPPAWFEQVVFKFDRSNSVPPNQAQSVRAIELLKVLRVTDPDLKSPSAFVARLREQHKK